MNTRDDTRNEPASSPQTTPAAEDAKPQVAPAVLDFGAFWRDVSTSAASIDAADELAQGSGRRVDTPVRKGFVRSLDDGKTPAPMSQIYAGGRSGIVAIKLYLALIWRCSAAPFSTGKPARAWATLLDLEDPNGKGVRRISRAMRALATSKLITLTEQDGKPNLVTLTNETGSGASYTLPSTAYARAGTEEQKTQHRYFKIAQRLWTEGYIQDLSGPATIMLLILLAEQADSKDVWFSTAQFPQRYRISHKTRAEGTRELVRRDLLTTHRESLSWNGGTAVFDPRRKRTLYRLTAVSAATADEV